MAIIITNGTHYIYLNENRGCKKTEDRSKATVFTNVDEAVKCIKGAPEKTRNYYVYDTIELVIICIIVKNADMLYLPIVLYVQTVEL